MDLDHCEFATNVAKPLLLLVGLTRIELVTSSLSGMRFAEVLLGLLLVALLTIVWVLGATMFNLITDLVGGIRVSVLEEEVLVSSVEGDGKRQ